MGKWCSGTSAPSLKPNGGRRWQESVTFVTSCLAAMRRNVHGAAPHPAKSSRKSYKARLKIKNHATPWLIIHDFLSSWGHSWVSPIDKPTTAHGSKKEMTAVA